MQGTRTLLDAHSPPTALRMEHADAEMVGSNYDIFDHSPERPTPSHGVDEVLHDTSIAVNFSRKRGPNDGRTSSDAGHGSKRHRHEQWPDKVEQPATSPARTSKFQEASMNERSGPSEQPPSVFTRHFDKHVSLSTDELMSQYHIDNDKPLPASPRRFRSPVRQRQSAPVAAMASTFSLETQDEESKASATGGIFKFGRSMASAFNPLNLVSKFTTGWRSAKEELLHEAEEVQKKQELVDRQIKAEQTYAELKLNGKLGAQGSNNLRMNAPIFTPGYTTATVRDEHQRDSGISMDSDTSKDSSLLPPDEESPRKSRRHRRTPSLHDLKKVASSISLHRRSASSSRSPEKQDVTDLDTEMGRLPRSRSRSNVLEFFGHEGGIGSLRGNKSKNNLTDDVDEFGNVRSRKKQTKLIKRVSDLESKLDAAKRELDRALAEPPPVPVVPATYYRRTLPRPERKSDSTHGFVPALPTLLSESLLLPPPTTSVSAVADDAHTVTTADVLHADDASVVATDVDMQDDEPLHESNGNSLYIHQNQPLLKGDITASPPSKENIPITSERVQKEKKDKKDKTRKITANPTTPSAEQTFLADASSPRTDSAKKSSSKKKKKNRHSSGGKKDEIDRSYRPTSEDAADDDAEWKEARAKKPKRKSDEFAASGTENSPKRSRLPVTTEATKDCKKTAKVLRKPVPAQPVKDLPPTPLDLAAASRSSLDTVPEERLSAHSSFSNVVPLAAGPPRNPTAKATPAAFHAHRSSSPASPSYGSPKRKRRVLTPKRARKAREERSQSPVLSSGRVVGDEEEMVVMKKPNGRDVPEMPSGGPQRALDNKSSFEWPEDVF